jgi:hypothetical protein
MMEKTEVQELIRRLNGEHQDDHDGGYALVAALKDARDAVEPDEREFFTESLADLVKDKDPELWAVALEALVQLGESQAVASLGDEVTESTQDERWKDYVVLGLLRLGQGRFRDPILEHVGASMANPRPLTLPIIAALCRIDREACLEIASKYFADAHRRGNVRELEGFVPAFVRNFVAVDDQLLAEFVRRLVTREPEVGRWLARSLSDYLAKPWIMQELGNERSKRLQGDVAVAAVAMN